MLDDTIQVKGVVFEDFVNYKKPCMVIEMPRCDFKCDRECGQNVCHNSALAISDNLTISVESIVQAYLNNSITEAICFQGLEPFDSFDDMIKVVHRLKELNCTDDIIVYTGYYKQEIPIEKLSELYTSTCGRLIIKWGRFIPNASSKYDEILGVTLASDNQYAEVINEL